VVNANNKEGAKQGPSYHMQVFHMANICNF